MEEIKRDKAPEETDGKEDKALDDKALEEASGGRRPPASVYHDKPFF